MTLKDTIALIPSYTHIDWRLQRVLRRVGIDYIEVSGCSDLVRARSQLLEEGLKTEAEKFLFIDSDMVPSVEHILELAQSEKLGPNSAVTGLYRVQPGKFAVQAEAPFHPLNTPRFVPFLVAGMGFAAVHRVAIERLKANIPEVVDSDENKWHPFFLPVVVRVDEGEVFHQYIPEDYSFWWRLKAGIEVDLWLDTHLCIGHVKQHVLMP